MCSVTVNIDGQEVRYFHAVKDGVDRVFVDHPWFLAKVSSITYKQVEFRVKSSALAKIYWHALQAWST